MPMIPIAYKYIDIHSHLNFPDYDADREEVIARMKENGVATITVGTSLETSRSAVALAEQHENIFACIGIHPVDEENPLFDEVGFEELIKHPKVVAVGECGLDYGREGVIDEASREKQKALFSTQIDFAVKHDKPIMIHARNAAEDILKILSSKKKEYGDRLRGNAHFFTGSPEEAQCYIDLGFSVSFTGVITFAREYAKTIKQVPMEHLMSETDAPFVAPIPYRGRRNEPLYVMEVVRKIAEIKGLEEEEVAKIILKNAVAKFNLV
jgi:TatD DNase family protein